MPPLQPGKRPGSSCCAPTTTGDMAPASPGPQLHSQRGRRGNPPQQPQQRVAAGTRRGAPCRRCTLVRGCGGALWCLGCALPAFQLAPSLHLPAAALRFEASAPS